MVTRWASIVAGVTALAIASCYVGVTVRQHLVADGSVATDASFAAFIDDAAKSNHGQQHGTASSGLVGLSIDNTLATCDAYGADAPHCDRICCASDTLDAAFMLAQSCETGIGGSRHCGVASVVIVLSVTDGNYQARRANASSIFYSASIGGHGANSAPTASAAARCGVLTAQYGSRHCRVVSMAKDTTPAAGAQWRRNAVSSSSLCRASSDGHGAYSAPTASAAARCGVLTAQYGFCDHGVNVQTAKKRRSIQVTVANGLTSGTSAKNARSQRAEAQQLTATAKCSMPTGANSVLGTGGRQPGAESARSQLRAEAQHSSATARRSASASDNSAFLAGSRQPGANSARSQLYSEEQHPSATARCSAPAGTNSAPAAGDRQPGVNSARSQLYSEEQHPSATCEMQRASRHRHDTCSRRKAAWQSSPRLAAAAARHTALCRPMPTTPLTLTTRRAARRGWQWQPRDRRSGVCANDAAGADVVPLAVAGSGSRVTCGRRRRHSR